MRLLLDTQAFLWASADEPRLARRARALIADGSNDVFLSSVVAWEIAIKHSNGRMPEITESTMDFVLSRIARMNLTPLPIDVRHALRIAELPPHHRDPFDRMLVAQAQVEGLTILSSDANIKRYDVEVLW